MQKNTVLLLLALSLTVMACKELEQVESGSAISSSSARLSAGAEVTGGNVGSKVFFHHHGRSGVIDLYDTETGTQASAVLSEPRSYTAMATIGSKLYIIGGLLPSGSQVSSRIDIYDADTDVWSSQSLTTARTVGQVAVIGTKLIVGGGTVISNNSLSSIEIIDTANWTRSTKTLSTGRGSAATVVVGNRVYFIGGVPCYSSTCSASSTIDVYDANTNAVTTIAMPRARISNAVVNGTKIYIGAGSDGNNYHNTIDILETSNNTWTNIAVPIIGQASIAGSVGKYVVFAGGNANSIHFSDLFLALNTETGAISSLKLTQGRYNAGLAVVKNKVYIAGGVISTGYTNSIEIFNSDSNELKSSK